MFGCVYRFENVPVENVTSPSPSQTAGRILAASAYYVRGVRFYELTDRRSPQPLFAMLFAHDAAKHYFDDVFECLMERSGLRADVLKPIEGELLRQLNLSVRAANATEFEQSGTTEGEHDAVPSALKELIIGASIH